jgi:hypothetical protein
MRGEIAGGEEPRRPAPGFLPGRGRLLRIPGPRESREDKGMLRELVVALVFLSLAVAVAMWFGGNPRIDVQTIEANLAK